MKAKKQSATTYYAHLEKVLTPAGLLLIVVGCLANVYGAYSNMRFIHDPIDLIYYFRYSILLAGGFAAGYLLTRKSNKTSLSNQLFIGVVYAALAMALDWVLDVIRVVIQNAIGMLSYPWGKALFMGMPLVVVIITSVIAYFTQYRSKRPGVSTFAKATLVLFFIVYQAYVLVTSSPGYDDPNIPIRIVISSYIIAPFTVALVSYFLLGGITKQFERLFYATLVGTFYGTLTFVLWEFRTDPSSAATNVFSGAVTIVALFFVGVLLWRARKH